MPSYSFAQLASRHTRIVDAVMRTSFPLIMRWPGDNPLCRFLCRDGDTRLAARHRLDLLEVGGTALRLLRESPYLTPALDEDISNILTELAPLAPYIRRDEVTHAEPLALLERKLRNAETLEDMAKQIAAFGVDHRQVDGLEIGAKIAIAMIEDGYKTIYNPRHPFYNDLLVMDGLPMPPERAPKSGAKAKGFLDSIEGALSNAWGKVKDMVTEDVKGAVAGGIAGAALGSTGLTPATVGGGAAAGAITGGVGKSAGKVIDDASGGSSGGSNGGSGSDG